MCPRSHASGLMSGCCRRSTSGSATGRMSSNVRARAAARRRAKCSLGAGSELGQRPADRPDRGSRAAFEGGTVHAVNAAGTIPIADLRPGSRDDPGHATSARPRSPPRRRGRRAGGRVRDDDRAVGAAGLIRSSQSDGEPRVYAVEDVAEAAIVAGLLARGVRHADVRATIRRLGRAYGHWPLSEAQLATTGDAGRPRSSCARTAAPGPSARAAGSSSRSSRRWRTCTCGSVTGDADGVRRSPARA